jgi:hypothetical protein
MSPKSRGRPPGRGRRKTKRPAGDPAWGSFAAEPDCWFGEPEAGDRESWAVPPRHGRYHDIDVELLDPRDENDLTNRSMRPATCAA